jgi:hypothetical protein
LSEIFADLATPLFMLHSQIIGMWLAESTARGVTMQMTYEGSVGLSGGDEFPPEETRDIPFFGFVMGTVISLGLWSMIAWTVWAVVD